LINRKLLTSLVFSISIAFSSGGYDHGTASGKGNLDFSITWNPFNYFDQGQSYAVIGYGLTNQLDIHSYYSSHNKENDSYYIGMFYQFFQSERLDLSTAVGFRRYKNQNLSHLFMPQLLYTLYLTEKVSIGGSFVNIRSHDLMADIGTAIDVFFIWELFENNNLKIDLTFGGFNPVLWEPKIGEWHPTYSLDIKIKNFLRN